MRNIVLLFTCLCCSTAYSQLHVDYEKNSRGEYEFYCVNSDFCNYTLEVEFTKFNNLQSLGELPYRGVVPPGKSIIFRLTKIVHKEGVGIHYRIHFAKGCINPKIDPDFTYLLPVKPGKQTQIEELQSIKKAIADEPEPKNWYKTRFKMNSGDTVYAARRGTVTAMRDTVELPDSNYAYVRKENYVEIYHSDCSFAEYDVLKAGSVLVRPGQFVEAGDPIGIAGGDKYRSGPQVNLSVHYNIDKTDAPQAGTPGRKHNHAYAPMKFWTKETQGAKLIERKVYTSEHPESIVTQEMNKREAKNWKEKHHA